MVDVSFNCAAAIGFEGDLMAAVVTDVEEGDCFVDSCEGSFFDNSDVDFVVVVFEDGLVTLSDDMLRLVVLNDRVG